MKLKLLIPALRLAQLAMLLVLVGLVAFGQATRGNLSGLVTDASGAVVSGASVTAKHVGTGEEFRAVADSQGAYIFPSIPLGQYTIVVEAKGFKRTEVQDVIVEVSNPAKVNVTMQVGEVNEAVVITGESQEVVNSTNATLANVISTKQVADLPLNGRNPIDLARLQAGIAVIGDGTRTASVAGLRGSATNVTQDGINAMDNFVKTDSFFAISAPSLNSISEFSVSVGTIGPDSGRGVGQVTMVTKSGTNQFHGGVFWNIFNDALNANTFFNNFAHTPKTIIRQNYFGGTLGGPVWLPKKFFGPASYDGRNKSFFFFSYEGFREPFSVTRNRTVLTAAARQGLFSYTGSNGQLQTVNLLNIGNFKTLNAVTQAQLNAMPAPNNTLIGDGFNTAGFQYNVGGKDPSNKYVGRYDQQLLENSRIGSHKLEFVFNRGIFLITPDTFNNNEATFPGGINAIQGSTRTLATAAIQSTFGSNMSNEFRVGHQRAPVFFSREAPPASPFFVTLNSVTNYELQFMSQGRNTLLYQYIDNFTMTKGSHTFRMGMDIESVTALTYNDAGIQQTITLGTNSVNGDGILNAAFPNLPAGTAGTTIVNRAKSVYADLAGILGSTTKTFNISSPTSGFVPGATRERDFKQRLVSFYFQDQWRARRNLTLNYGLRWEFQGVPYEKNGLAIQPTNDIAGLFGISGLNNLFKPGTLGGSATTTLDFVNGKTGKKLYGNDWNNFAPYLGLAYSPNFERGPMHWIFGNNGKSSIRAGYSISYLQDGFTVVSNALGTGTTNPGLIQSSANNTPTGVLSASGIALPTPVFQIPITDAQNFAINNTNGLWTFDPNLRTPYVQQWSFGIEREIANNTAIEVRYVGNHAVKVFRAIDFNEVNIFENGFLNEFLGAQKNLAINGGASFAPGAAGTVPLPTLTTLFNGLAASSGFASTTFINNLNNNNVGTMAFTLANSPTYANTRKALAPNFFLANPNASFARLLSNGSYSTYNSLQVELRRRLSKGLLFQADYTFSKALTDSDSGSQVSSQSTLETYRTLRNLALDKHRAAFDQTHRFIANFIYDLPFGTGRRWLSSGFTPLRKTVEGWRLGGIVTKQTGPPIYIASGRATFNQFATNIGAQFAGASFSDFLNNAGVFKTASGVYFFDPKLLTITTNASGAATAASLNSGLLTAPAPGTFGNFPRNSINAPGFTQVDFSLIKQTRIYEKVSVDFKATFYNAFNQANFSFATQNFDSTSFGRITGTRGSARTINFNLAINF